jgi:hypothetical protein
LIGGLVVAGVAGVWVPEADALFSTGCSLSTVDWSQDLEDALASVDLSQLDCTDAEYEDAARDVMINNIAINCEMTVRGANSLCRGVAYMLHDDLQCGIVADTTYLEISRQADSSGNGEAHVYWTNATGEGEGLLILAASADDGAIMAGYGCEADVPDRNVVINAFYRTTSPSSIGAFLPDVYVPPCGTAGAPSDPSWTETPTPATFGSPWGSSGFCRNEIQVVYYQMVPDLATAMPVFRPDEIDTSVAVYVDGFNRSLPGGGTVHIWCLTGAVGGPEVSPCNGLAGFVFEERIGCIVCEDDVPNPAGPPEPEVWVCQAELTLRLLGPSGPGISDFPVWTTCSP